MNRENSKVFENIPIIGFKKGKSLKDILVRAKVPPLKTEGKVLIDEFLLVTEILEEHCDWKNTTNELSKF